MLIVGTAPYRDEVKKIEDALNWNMRDRLTVTQIEFYRDHLLREWELAKAAIEVAKDKEMDLRKQIVALATDPNKKSGTERIPLSNGYELKTVKKLNYGFLRRDDGKTDKDRIEDALEAIEKRSPAGTLIADRLVKWTPDLSLTEYKQLTPEDKAIIDAVIVVSEGAPTVEIIPPKGK